MSIPKQERWWHPASIGGWILGFLIWKFFGWSFLIPLFSGLFWGWVASKRFKSSLEPLALPFTIMAAHLSWGIIGIALLALQGQFSYYIADVILLGGGMFWLIAQTGLPPVIYLLIYKSFALINHVWLLASSVLSLGSPGFDRDMLAALIIHSILDIASIASVLWAYRKWKTVSRFTAPASTC